MTERGETGDESNFGARTDRPTREDELGFASYVEAVKTFVTSDSTKPPLTISIEGEWGSGKSSFMQQLKSSLDEEEHITVEFNPWKHERQEAVWAAFALKFLEDVREQTNLLEGIIKRGKLWTKRYRSNTSTWAQIKFAFNLLIFLIPVALLTYMWIEFGTNIVISGLELSGSNNQLLKIFLQSGGLLTGVLTYVRIWSYLRTNLVGSLEQNLVDYASDPEYGDKMGFINSFHKDFKNILDVYIENDKRVFVFIDDLDRCTVPKAADLMQAINLILSDDDRLIFILGLDRARVAAGMAAKHDELLDILNEDPTNQSSRLGFGYQYLEKFIQIPFLVPEPKEQDIRGLMMGNVDDNGFNEDIDDYWKEIIEEYENNLGQIVEMVVPALGSNPRQVKRFMNLYQLRAVLAHIEGVLELEKSRSRKKVTLPQLGKFVIISIQWPQFISKIYNDPSALDRLIKWKDEEEDVDIKGLERWGSDPELLELLDYGESEEYDLRKVNIGDLMKISPRVDIPSDSEKGVGTIQRNIQISCISDDIQDIRPIIDPLSETTGADIRYRRHNLTDSRHKLSKALHSYIWVIDTQVASSDVFEELYDSVPSSTTVILFGENNLPGAVQELDGNIIPVESIKELEKVIKSSVNEIADTNKKGSRKWETWRNEATKSRDDYLHGF